MKSNPETELQRLQLGGGTLTVRYRFVRKVTSGTSATAEVKPSGLTDQSAIRTAVNI